MAQCSTCGQGTVCIAVPLPFLGTMLVIEIDQPGGCGCGTTCDEPQVRLRLDDNGCGVKTPPQGGDQPVRSMKSTPKPSRMDLPAPVVVGHLSGCG
ncbi:MAG: hypothetical protein ACE5KM_09575 [Planctomycetaceae bacterium]